MTVVSLVLVAGGLLGAGMGGPHWLVALSYLGLFGPFVLRELGLSRWRDDFQRETVMRSGMHGLLAMGVVMLAVILVQGAGGQADASGKVTHLDAFPVSVLFLVLAFTWGMSWLVQYWGARRGACRLWLIVMSVATVAAVSGYVLILAQGQSMGVRGTVMGLVQLAVGWALAFTCRRWPRVTGVALVILTAVVGWKIMPTWFELGDPGMLVTTITAAAVPLLVPGLALLLGRDEDLEQQSA